MKKTKSTVETSGWELLEFPLFSDERGETIPFELGNQFPFPVKRVYIVTGNDSAVRGGHAHKEEEEVFVVVSGSVTAVVNNGDKDQEIILHQKNQGLLIHSNCWHEFKNFSTNAVLLAFSSTHFEGRTGYIENKEEFMK